MKNSVESDEDFEDYMDEFETAPPNPDWPDCD